MDILQPAATGTTAFQMTAKFDILVGRNIRMLNLGTSRPDTVFENRL